MMIPKILEKVQIHNMINKFLKNHFLSHRFVNKIALSFIQINLNSVLVSSIHILKIVNCFQKITSLKFQRHSSNKHNFY